MKAANSLLSWVARPSIADRFLGSAAEAGVSPGLICSGAPHPAAARGGAVLVPKAGTGTRRPVVSPRRRPRAAVRCRSSGTARSRRLSPVHRPVRRHAADACRRRATKGSCIPLRPSRPRRPSPSAPWARPGGKSQTPRPERAVRTRPARPFLPRGAAQTAPADSVQEPRALRGVRGSRADRPVRAAPPHGPPLDHQRLAVADHRVRQPGGGRRRRPRQGTGRVTAQGS